MSSELFIISTPIASSMASLDTVGGGAGSTLKPSSTISSCWSHEDLNQYFTKSVNVVQPKKSLDTNSIHERDMHARVNLNKIPITLDTNNLTRNRVSSISINSPSSLADLTPIVEKENKRAKAKRILNQLLSKKSRIIVKKPVTRKTSMIIKFIVTCAALNILGFITFAAIVTFVLPNLFMHPAAYVSVSAKHHLLHEDATLYRKLVHTANIPETLVTFPDNTITSNTDDNGESFNRKAGLKIDVSRFNLLKNNEEKKETPVDHDIHPPFATMDHVSYMKGNHRDRLVDYIEALPHKNDPLIDFGLEYKNISFSSLYEKNKMLRGWYVEANDKNSKKAVVIVHGAFYDRRDVLEHLPYIHKLGVHVLLFDMLNHGVSDGDEGCSLGYREWMGVMGAIDYLEGIVPDVEVVAFGSSTGAASSIVAASQDPRIKAIIAENPFAERTLQIKDVLESALYKNGWSHQLPSLFAGIIESYGKFIPELLIRGVSVLVNWRMCDFSVNPYHASDAMREMSKPLLLMHSKTDKVVDFKHSQILSSLASGPIEYWIVEDAPHSCIHRHLKDEFEERVISFLQKYLLKQ
ncbi:predicted protein [Naegleria gruberi]|uniref:Predicted protein n=1 Tax=Naegleria gruberi TaxID=5762 RepID=D2VVA1_NAEGR|nr:uncharacterized protein NAEGRDRAFT_81350 [Naegleria gruberi]EFC39274.1 predicted protein [Naegleria gruberi]|eukprot:XP_002672018.1 predicted protein [Naegleria gruberi strain NEG-M]